MNVNLLTYREHDEESFLDDKLVIPTDLYEPLFTKKHRGKDASLPCFSIRKSQTALNSYRIKTGYFIGVDWIQINQSALHVRPKLNELDKEVDFIKMLFSSLRHTDVAKEINELFEVKWDLPTIEIGQKQDLLTPFLVVEFLSLIKKIVRKGLKKSYYKVEQNLHSKVKGKILVGKSIKLNLQQNKNLYTYCSYDEFGLNNKENRLLKKALTFVKRYLPHYPNFTNNKDLQDTFNYINPTFYEVSDEIDLNEIKHSKTNAFYKEYEPAIHLAKQILRRFGYNISNTEKVTIKTPPFWIDMSKLFELYALGLLKDRFQNQIKFQFKYYGNELDFLLKTHDYQMVIDAKYKMIYLNGSHDEDIRQVSGYARLRKVYEDLGKKEGEVIDCLIIYPDQENGLESLKDVELKSNEIKQYFGVYKLGLKLPYIK
ncbi:restriction endonuclease [Flavobacterium psychroterrae]|uniref:Restriction endonuclease n=1 Tax=Flavobacterium psychroterrae TaxID=2133767 RepID=A0ABS5PH95_9FLAO|nr:McrC family protein [Flavobacterium psychroterrae]MBS7233649.1 restriction endonuclease [Flavobacterium psychroterrae]